MAGRSRHRSQDTGALQRPGPNPVRVGLLETRGPGGRDTGFFAGVDTLLPGRERYVAEIDSARARLNPSRPGPLVPLLARALRELGDGDAEQRGILQRALATAAGVAIDGVTDDDIVIPGERLQVEASVWNAGDSGVVLDGTEVTAPAGCSREQL